MVLNTQKPVLTVEKPYLIKESGKQVGWIGQQSFILQAKYANPFCKSATLPHSVSLAYDYLARKIASIFCHSIITQHLGIKSDNLQYNTLVRWVAGTNDSSTNCLMFQVLFFFIISCKILCNIKIKSFECPKTIRNYEKNNAWNIRHLVDESFIPSTQ